MENNDCQTQINGLRNIADSLGCFERCLVWGHKKKKARKFDIMTNISFTPTVVIPYGCDGGIQHVFTTVGRYIFDSTTKHAMHLTKESLDWSCNTKLGFQGVYFAIRFPLKAHYE